MIPSDVSGVGPDDRLLAEAVRAFEEDGALPVNEPPAEALARRLGGRLEARISHRGAALSVASALRDALHTVRRLLGWTVVGWMVVASLTGAGAVRAGLGGASGEPINVFWVLLSLLGIQTLLLFGWAFVALVHPASLGATPLAGAVLAAGRWLTVRLHDSPHHIAAIQAYAGVFARATVGRWTLSAITHGLWLAFNVGALVLLLGLLSTRQYVFNWETTILSSGAYERITGVIGTFPGAIGFQTPTRQQVVETESGGGATSPDAARAWSGLLVGTLLVYGLVPRGLLLGLSVVLRRRAWNSFRLDTSAPGHHRLRSRLMPEAESSGVVEDRKSADHAIGVLRSEVPITSVTAGTGPPAILGFEIEPPVAWPPEVPSVDWVDLGFVDGREDRHHVREALGGMSNAPRMTVVACSLTTTPDRGMGVFLAQVATATSGPMALLLTGGDQMRHRGGPAQLVERVASWRDLAGTVGIDPERVLELDLDYVTDGSRARFAELLAVGGSAIGVRRIEPAFSLIVDAVGAWARAPNTEQQASLHRGIARLYQSESRALGAFLRVRNVAPPELAGVLRDGASRVGRLLPDQLRTSSRWMTAGAAAGGLGCLAVGTLLTPAAFAVFPVWAAGGAGLAAFLKGIGVDSPPADAVQDDLAQGVRPAVLFALILHLQGRDEVEISSVLGHVLSDPDEPGVIGPKQRAMCQRWLDELRDRLDVALATERVR